MYKKQKILSPLTIFEILPKDIVNNIRFWLAKADFRESLVEIKKHQTSFDKYEHISQNCHNNKLQGIFHSFPFSAQNNVFRHIPNKTFTSISVNVLENQIIIPQSYCMPYPCIENILHYLDQEDINYIYDVSHYDIHYDEAHYDTDLMVNNILYSIVKLVTYIVDRVLEDIDSVKTEYKNTIAIPNIPQYSHMGNMFWLDTKECFKKYLFEHYIINRRKQQINNLIDIIIFNLGYRLSIRQQILHQKERLNTINY